MMLGRMGRPSDSCFHITGYVLVALEFSTWINTRNGYEKKDMGKRHANAKRRLSMMGTSTCPLVRASLSEAEG